MTSASRNRRLAAAFLLSASAVAIAAPASARTTLFASDKALAAAAERGERVTQQGGVTQVRLDNGGTASFVAGASYQIQSDGSIDLYSGSVTVAGGKGAAVVVRLADQGSGEVSGEGSAASFSVETGEDGRNEARGHVLNGQAAIRIGGGAPRSFAAGQMWRARGGKPELAVAIGEQAVPDEGAAPQVADMGEGGPLAAAQNGVPVVLGDALAAAGAGGDIVAAARRVEAAVAAPAIETFPSGDLARLVAYAGQLQGVYGGTPFNGAAADVIRTYLQYLANGGSGAQFLTVYSGLMVQYLDLLRTNALPSAFAGASQAQINSFIAYRGRMNGFGALSAQNRALVEAYLAFIQGGGQADLFVPRYTDLTNAYFAFLRGGGDPAAFAGASQQTINAYLTFLRDAGLLGRLTAQNQALLNAWLASLAQGGNGFAFAEQYRVALDAYFAFLAEGRLPSTYTAADIAQLRSYLETLQSTGLFERVLGSRAQFYAGYLAWLQGGGSVDGYAQLPANIFSGYATALNAWYAYLAAGGRPSEYTAVDPAVLQTYLQALANAGASSRFLGGNAQFYAQYLAFLNGGGSFDAWEGLNLNIFTGYATALKAYYDYLEAGGVPTGYTALTQEQISAYLAAINAAGANARFLGTLSDFWSAFFAYLSQGGNPDLYAGLPVPPDYPAFASALNAYAAYLAGGGLPGSYTGLDLTVLRSYIQAIINAGRLNELLGANATLLSGYFTHLANGGAVNGWSGLPVYATYQSALSAYYAYLQGGGLPSAYTALTPAQLQAYLQALVDAGVFNSLFSGAQLTFLTSYYNHVSGGGSANGFTGLPVYADYVAALQAYYTYLQNGGLPSGYTAYSLAQLQAWLQALIDAGVFSSLFNAQLASFFQGYYAYVSGGGTPNSYTGLPVNSGGSGGGSGSTNPAYAGGFTATSGIQMFAALGTNNGGSFSGQELTVNADGSFSSTSAIIRPGTATFTDVGGDSRGLVGRMHNGTVLYNGNALYNYGANNGGSYLLMAPISGSLPTSGVIKYDVVAATRPVYDDGHTAPGAFAARFAVGFGSTLRYAIDGTITMADATYTVRAGNVAAGTTVAPQVSSQSFFVVRPTISAGPACPAGNCQVNMFGAFGGSNPQERLGFAYHTIGSPTGKTITGAVLFGQEGTIPASGGGSTATGAPTGSGLRYLGSGTIYRSASNADFGFVNGLKSFAGATVTAGSDGQIQSAVLAPTTTYTRATATDAEFGGSDGVIGWSRWAGGTVTYTTSAFAPASGTEQLRGNGGYAQIWGQPATNLPTSGTATYNMVGATAPMRPDGTIIPGSVDSATLAVNFATLRAGYQSMVTAGGVTYEISTAGGIASPNAPINADRMFSAVNGNTRIMGFLAGNGASHAGVSYFIGDAPNGIAGVVALKKTP